MNKLQEKQMLEHDYAMSKAGINGECRSQATKMRMIQDGDWVKIYIRSLDGLKILVVGNVRNQTEIESEKLWMLERLASTYPAIAQNGNYLFTHE